MSLKSTRICIALAILVSVLSISCYTQAVDGDATDRQALKRDAEPWRTSFEAFVKAIDEFSGEIPFSKADNADMTGERVSGDAAIMKRFGGAVEFEGVFQGIEAGSFSFASEKKKDKIDISMAWPDSRKPNTSWKLHLYPKAASLEAWRALAPKTPIKFRAVVTGITEARTFITGVDLRAYSILLEEGEIVNRNEKPGEQPK